MESPTGTGKSLTLLTSTLTWLAANEKRLNRQSEDVLRVKMLSEDPDGEWKTVSCQVLMVDPPWVIEHAVKRQMEDQRAVHQARQERLAKAREREKKIRQTGSVGAFKNGERKRVKVGSEENDGVKDQGDEEFLPEDKVDKRGQGIYLSKEVRELMAKWVIAVESSILS